MNAVEDIFCRFRIVPTEQRVAVLKLILDVEISPFSIQELRHQIHASGLPVCDNTLVTTLQLLVARKVLRTFPAPKIEKKKGRPQMLYVVDPLLQFARSTSQTEQRPKTSEDVEGIDFH
jgi:hypothetical protein